MYASSDTFNGNQACYPVVPTSAIWSDGFNMGSICDFDTSSGVTVSAFSPGLNYVEFSIPTAQITSFSILIYQNMPYYTNMQWQAYDIGSGKWSDYYVSSPVTVASQLYVDVTMGDSTSPNSNKIRFYPLKANRVPTEMIKYIPRVCHLAYSTEQKIPQFKEQYELKKDESFLFSLLTGIILRLALQPLLFLMVYHLVLVLFKEHLLLFKKRLHLRFLSMM